MEGQREIRRKGGAEEDDYDPHKFRVIEKPTTNWETVIHLLKGSLGTGILAMPEAFRHAGLVLGFISTFVLGALCIYCLLVLIHAQYHLCKRHKLPLLTYPQSMELALSEGPDCLKRLSRASFYIVDAFLILFQMGICCVYVVFVAENLKQFFDAYVVTLDVKIHICIIFVPLLLISLIRDLKKLAPFSALGNILTFIGFGIVMYYIFSDLPPISNTNYVGEIKDYPLYFGTVLFALEAVGVIITLENNMKTPKSFGGFCGVFSGGMSVIVVMYAAMGFFGYWRYAEDCVGSITLNIPKDEPLAQSVRIIFTLAIYISYALQGYVPVDIVWNQHLKKKCQDSEKFLLYEYLVRTANVVITCLLAIAIPRLGLFISLFGAFCLSALGFIFPATIELCAHWPDDLGPWKLLLIKDILIALLGLTGLICGTYCSIRDIINSFK